VVNLLGYQSSESETVNVASPQESMGAEGLGAEWFSVSVSWCCEAWLSVGELLKGRGSAGCLRVR